MPGALLMIVLIVARRRSPSAGSAPRSRCYTGQASVVQGLFPLVFVILFLSTAFFPANLLLEPAALGRRVQPALASSSRGSATR